jgi:hypothetical protein
VPRKKEKNMKRICAVLGLALLAGCGNTPNNSDCPRKDKSCGKSLTHTESSTTQQKEVVQEVAPVLENVTPSK